MVLCTSSNGDNIYLKENYSKQNGYIIEIDSDKLFRESMNLFIKMNVEYIDLKNDFSENLIYNVYKGIDNRTKFTKFALELNDDEYNEFINNFIEDFSYDMLLYMLIFIKDLKFKDEEECRIAIDLNYAREMLNFKYYHYHESINNKVKDNIYWINNECCGTIKYSSMISKVRFSSYLKKFNSEPMYDVINYYNIIKGSNAKEFESLSYDEIYDIYCKYKTDIDKYVFINLNYYGTRLYKVDENYNKEIVEDLIAR